MKRKIEILNNVWNLIESDSKRIGGTCGLYLHGVVDEFRDIDIIVDSIDSISLNFPTIPFNHKKRLNKGLKYNVDGLEVDVLETIVSSKPEEWKTIHGLRCESVDAIMVARKTLNDFLKEVYQEEGKQL
ncbi:MAG: hypothetical protein J6B82_05770 [Bacteroidaceae bacterium]|nr:hypothetical protein [Bacteroidaceae bacterium]